MKTIASFISIVLAFAVFAKSENTTNSTRPEDREWHELFSAALSAHVKDGLVDYRRIADDENFKDFLKWLETATPELLGDDQARIAFWVNAYNALTIKGVIDNSTIFIPPQSSYDDSKSLAEGLQRKRRGEDSQYGLQPIKSVLDVDGFFDEKKYKVANQKLTLDEIEKEIIFPMFEDPRLHFVLVCAAVSCPKLPSQAYSGSDIQARMDSVAVEFLNNTEKNHLDEDERILYLSQIFNWYQEDFQTKKKSVLDFIIPYLDETGQRFLSENQVQIRYLDYNWNLNVQPD